MLDRDFFPMLDHFCGLSLVQSRLYVVGQSAEALVVGVMNRISSASFANASRANRAIIAISSASLAVLGSLFGPTASFQFRLCPM